MLTSYANAYLKDQDSSFWLKKLSLTTLPEYENILLDAWKKSMRILILFLRKLKINLNWLAKTKKIWKISGSAKKGFKI